MKPKTVVLSLPVADLERALRFYRDGLGLSAAAEDEGAVLFELPNLSLFLIEREEYATYTDRAGCRHSRRRRGGRVRHLLCHRQQGGGRRHPRPSHGGGRVGPQERGHL